MTNAALRGKPDAGNPHVRFDEGEVASCTAEASLRRVHCRRQPEGRASVCAATPRRGSLLYVILYFYESNFTLWQRRLAGICAGALTHGWMIHPINVDTMSVHDKNAIRFWRPLGVIVEGGAFTHRKFNKKTLAGLPVVCCDAGDAAIGKTHYEVRLDSAAIAHMGAEELVRLDCESYAYVHYYTHHEWSVERCREMRRVAEAAGAPFYEFDSVRGCWRMDVGSFLVRLAGFLKRLPRPCGVLAANDEMASLVIVAANRAGISIPDELAVVGIDNNYLVCENTQPTLTSVTPDFERSGRMAVDLLARFISEKGAHPVVETYGSPVLMRRRSTRLVTSKDPRIVRAIEFIRRNACGNATVASVVEVMGMKIRSAESLFKQVCGCSIRDEIMSVRLAQAKRLLSDTDLSIMRICERCGYADERSLRYMFVKATGVSPRDWRMARRN